MEILLSDLLVVELANVLAGPSVGMFFAELGAKIIKIENKKTNGDITRQWKSIKEKEDEPSSAYYHSINWGKESHLLDLSSSDDFGIAMDWIKRADIIICNFKAGSAKKLQLDYASLKKINPKLIYASISAYGDNDSRPGFDGMIQAETGWISMNGPAEGDPIKLPVALIDILAAHQLKEGILVALINRGRTGRGCKVSVSLFDAAISALANQASNYLNLGLIPKPKGSQHPNIAPYGEVFYTADRIPIMVAIGTDLQFEGLCKVLKIQHIKEEDKFNTNSRRITNRAALEEILADGFRLRNAEDILILAQKYQIPLSPIKNLKQVFESPLARALILEQKDESGRIVKCVQTKVFKITS